MIRMSSLQTCKLDKIYRKACCAVKKDFKLTMKRSLKINRDVSDERVVNFTRLHYKGE